MSQEVTRCYGLAWLVADLKSRGLALSVEEGRRPTVRHIILSHPFHLLPPRALCPPLCSHPRTGRSISSHLPLPPSLPCSTAAGAADAPECGGVKGPEHKLPCDHQRGSGGGT